MTQLTNVDSIFTDVARIRLRQNELEKKISELKEDLKTTNNDFLITVVLILVKIVRKTIICSIDLNVLKMIRKICWFSRFCG